MSLGVYHITRIKIKKNLPQKVFIWTQIIKMVRLYIPVRFGGFKQNIQYDKNVLNAAFQGTTRD